MPLLEDVVVLELTQALPTHSMGGGLGTALYAAEAKAVPAVRRIARRCVRMGKLP
jgi:hypothetical protein